jgi:hypothetical protein
MRHRIRIPMKGGEEQDMLTRWRRLLVVRAGRAKAAKRTYNRRLRRCAHEEITR